MIFRKVQELIGSDREATGHGWKSRRLILANDGLPFSVHETTVAAGTGLHLTYARHSETVYCIEGKASIAVGRGQGALEITPGTLYSAAIGDVHVLRAAEETRFLCIFEPALVGREQAD
jgi:L-ectoine synthase